MFVLCICKQVFEPELTGKHTLFLCPRHGWSKPQGKLRIVLV